MKILAILIYVLMSIAGAQAEEACYFEIDLISDDLVWLDTYYGEGIGDLSGRLLTPAEWESVRYLGDNIACGEREDGVYLIDLGSGVEKKLTVESCYDVRYFSEGLALICIDDLWGYIDRSGDIVIEPEYDMSDDLLSSTSVQDTHSFVAGIACVSKDGKYGVIDKEGNTVVPFEYDYARSCECGLVRVIDGDIRSLLDSEGNLIFNTDCAFKHASDFTTECKHESDRMIYRDGERYGFIDMRGNIISEAQWDYADEFSEGYARVKKDEKWNYIDTEGKLLFDTWYEELGGFENGLMYAWIDGREGIIDIAGNWVLEPVYDIISIYGEPFGFHDESGYRSLEKEDLYGVLSPDNDPVTDIEFSYVGAYGDDRINVCKNDKYGYINGAGEVVVDFVYDEAMRFIGGFAIVAKDGKYGVIDTEGSTVIECVYENILSYADGFAVVKIDQKWGMVDADGRIVIEPVYYKAYTRDDSAGNLYYLFADLDTESLYNTTGKLIY